MRNLPRKANLGSGPLPLYPQDEKYMGDDWQSWLLVDKFIEGPGISNWDIEVLSEVPDQYLTEIFTSHALEHISHQKVEDTLRVWYNKLQSGGRITILVPDLMYALNQLRALENEQIPQGYYNDFFGPQSPLTIIYGTHTQPGEHHFGGFTKRLMEYILEKVGFTTISVISQYDDHQMNSLIAVAYKP